MRLQDPPCPWDENSCVYAASRDNLEVLTWVRERVRKHSQSPRPWEVQCYDGLPDEILLDYVIPKLAASDLVVLSCVDRWTRTLVKRSGRVSRRVGGRRRARALDLFNSVTRMRWARANNLSLYEEAFIRDVKEGTNLEVLKCLLLEHPDPYYDGYRWYKDASIHVAFGGQLEMLKWTREEELPCAWNPRSCAFAAKEGNLETLTGLRAQTAPCPWDKKSCRNAAFGGHWTRNQDPPCPWDAVTSACAAARGDLEMLRWLRAQQPPCPWDEQSCHSAASEGRLEVLKWLRLQDPPCPWNEETTASAVENLDKTPRALGTNRSLFTR